MCNDYVQCTPYRRTRAVHHSCAPAPLAIPANHRLARLIVVHARARAAERLRARRAPPGALAAGHAPAPRARGHPWTWSRARRARVRRSAGLRRCARAPHERLPRRRQRWIGPLHCPVVSRVSGGRDARAPGAPNWVRAVEAGGLRFVERSPAPPPSILAPSPLALSFFEKNSVHPHKSANTPLAKERRKEAQPGTTPGRRDGVVRHGLRCGHGLEF